MPTTATPATPKVFTLAKGSFRIVFKIFPKVAQKWNSAYEAEVMTVAQARVEYRKLLKRGYQLAK